MKNNQRFVNYDINSKFNDDLPFLRIFRRHNYPWYIILPDTS
jgi:hypothetical protein